MKTIKALAATVITGGLLTLGATANAADHEGHSNAKGVQKAKPYPLKTCAVSGEKLGSMGKPYVFVHKGQEFQLCCKGCIKNFNKEPAKFKKKLEQAEKSSKPTKEAPKAPPHNHSGHQH